MKTPKEKAEELYFKFFSITPEYLNNDECVEFAIQCALIAVDELINPIEIGFEDYKSLAKNSYWFEVKIEIINL